MREFYVYGFKSRDDYDKKSARSYDDERRRMESWLGEHMRFIRTPEGKNVFISIDTRNISHNPLYKAWKTKSFTDGDITLHFILFDILHAPDMILSLSDIMTRMDEEYLSAFDEPMIFDESTVRKKLKEYISLGLISAKKQGKTVLYHRTADTDISHLTNALDFYSEAVPCGVIGSFLLDKLEPHRSIFTFKHHYMTSAIDSEVIALLFTAMREKRIISAIGHSRRNPPQSRRLIPLRLFISAQNGRQHLLAYDSERNRITSLRVDYLSDIKLLELTPRFDELRAQLSEMQKKMWGVSVGNDKKQTEHVSFTVKIEKGENYIIGRLEREKRIGTVEKIDENTYRFSAEVYDTNELIPWIRTFICRITDIQCSNRAVEHRFRQDLKQMYHMYGIGEREETT
ncbi:MAG: WYL domain-containing protein [Clostridia bacterium]|nr:WYL domain-containing protein [Clostridia bacterium]